MNINIKELFKEGFLLVALTFTAFSSCYFYEYGSCEAYGIPKEYIDIDLSDNVVVGFIFLGITFPFLMTDTIFKNIHFKIRKTIFLTYLAVLIFWTWLVNDHKFFSASSVTFLLIIFIAGLYAYLFNIGIADYPSNKKIEETENETTYKDESDKQKVKPLNFIITFYTSILLLLCMLGYEHAYQRRDFFINSNGNLVLLKKYGSNIIYGQIKGDTLAYGNVIIETNLSKVDTLLTAKFTRLNIVKHDRAR